MKRCCLCSGSGAGCGGASDRAAGGARRSRWGTWPFANVPLVAGQVELRAQGCATSTGRPEMMAATAGPEAGAAPVEAEYCNRVVRVRRRSASGRLAESRRWRRPVRAFRHWPAHAILGSACTYRHGRDGRDDASKPLHRTALNALTAARAFGSQLLGSANYGGMGLRLLTRGRQSRSSCGLFIRRFAADV